MKYTVEGFDQETLVNLGLDATDAVILRYIVDFYSTGKMTKVNYEGEEYFWLKYDAVIAELPIIKISNKIALARRLNKFVECGILKKLLYQNAGNYTCFKLTDAYEGLISKVKGATQKYIGGKLKSTKGLNSKVNTKDSSSNDPSTKNIYSDDFETFWKAYPRNVNKAGAYKAWKARLKEGVTVDTLMSCAINYSARVKSDKTEPNFILHAKTFLNPDHRFEDFGETVAPEVLNYTDKNGNKYVDGIKTGHWDGGRFIPIRAREAE